MSFAFNGLTALVSINGIVVANALPSGATQIQKGMYQLTVATTLYTMYTVTGGKTLFITSLQVAGDSGGILKIGDNITNAEVSGTVYDNAIFTHVATVGSLSPGPIIMTFPVPWKITNSLKFVNNGAGNLGIGFVGYEQ